MNTNLRNCVSRKAGSRSGGGCDRPCGCGLRKAGARSRRYTGRLVQERSGANTPRVSYTRGRDLSGGLEGAGGIGGLLARSHGYSGGNWSSHNFYHADGNGNVTALVNSSGTLQASYKYDPYGRLRSQTGALSNANRLRWSSKPWEGYGPSGLYSYGYRYYDPYLQRWLNPDPIEEYDGPKLYAFVHNDPLDKIDPDGRLAAIIREALKRAAPHLAKCKNLRCKVAFHGPHHTFPVVGTACHIQVTCWVKGSKGSGLNLRIPVPDFMCPGKKTPPTRPPAAPPTKPPSSQPAEGSSSVAGVVSETEGEQPGDVDIE